MEPSKVNFANLQWKRLSEIYGEDFVIFPENIDSSDILQGAIGDCYFVTCLVALAAKPDRIKKLFKTTAPNKAGCYVLNFYINGILEEVVIDDLIPVDPVSGNPCFGKSKQSGEKNVVWVSLVEKAWAKLCGNYDRVISGTVDMGFIHLCGVPSVGYKHLLYKNKKQELWNAFKDAFKNNHIMTAGTEEKEKAEEL